MKMPTLAVLALVSTQAFAAPEAQLIVGIKNNITQLTLKADRLCDSQNFSIKLLDRETKKAEVYKSNSGATSWALQNCQINQAISKDVLVAGKVIQVVTYDKRGGEMHTFAAAVPCKEDVLKDAQVITLSEREGSGMDQKCKVEEKNIKFNNGAAKVEAPIANNRMSNQSQQQGQNQFQQQNQQQQQPQVNNCVSEVRQNGTNPYIYIGCAQADIISVEAELNGIPDSNCTRLVEVRAQTDMFNQKSQVCYMSRDPRTTSVVTVRIKKGRDTVVEERVSRTKFYKDASHNYAVQAQYESSTQMLLEKNNKLMGRGNYWRANIEVSVSDRDLDDDQREIKVQLIKVSEAGEQVLEEQMAASNRKVQFAVEHHWVTPYFGKNHDDGPFNREFSTQVKVRVIDAYGGQSLDLGNVDITLAQ